MNKKVEESDKRKQNGIKNEKTLDCVSCKNLRRIV